MNTHYLAPLFTPDSIAVFGASDRADSVGEIVYRNLLSGGYAGRIYAINPAHRKVQDRKAYSSVDKIGEPVDLAVVATPASTVPAIIEACGEYGIHAALILSAGFRESGAEGRRLEDRVMEAAKRYGIRVMGPNCLGIIRPDRSLNITFGRNAATPGNLALVSQSGALCTAILDWAEANEIGFSAVVSTGISADLDFGDYLDYLVSDPLTKSILLYIEGIRDARQFMSSLRAAARIKPVIALKAGRHAQGAQASLSHTGALVGSDRTFSAALSRSGALRVETISQLFAAARALSSRYRGASDRLAIITNGGGPGVMAADRVADLDIVLSELGADTLQALDGVLPAVWSRGNPVDIIGDATPERYQQALEICLRDEAVDGALVILTPQAMTRPTEVAEVLVESADRSDKPIMACWMGGRQIETATDLFNEARIPSFHTPENAVDAYSFLAAYSRNQRLLLQTPAKITRGQEPPDIEGAGLIIEGCLNEQRNVLTEPESLAVLKSFRIPVIQNGVAYSANEALVVAESIGFPVAMKILSTDISHKSEVGGIRLNINSAREVRAVYREIIEQVSRERPEAKISGVTLEKMYRRPNGRELMIGIVRDSVFGPVISVGGGGTQVEVIGDSELALPPLNRRLATDLIHRTRASRLLGRFRNMPAVDIEVLVDVLLCVSNLACELPWIQELDINPLIIDEAGVVAVDARIRVDFPPVSTDPYHHLAIHPYPAHLVTKLQLQDGTDVIIRPIRPEDAEIEQQFVRGLSSEAKHFRFMSSLQELSRETLIRFTQIDYHDEMALIAVRPEETGEQEIAVARYVTNPDRRSCEFALVVSDRWQRRGIAHHLLQKLIEVARGRGLEKMLGEVLRTNSKMLELVKSFGFEVKSHPTDNSILRVELRFD